MLAETTTVDARRHGELLASSIDAVLTEVGAGRLDITAVAAGTGPGPYTGLRAGLVTARVLGSALGVPVYGVCTLDVIAADAAAAARGPGVHRGHRRPAARGVLGPVRRLRAAAWTARRSASPPTWRTGRRQPGQPRPAHPGSHGPQTRGAVLAAGAGALLYPGVLGEPIGPSYPAAGTLARLAARQLAAGAPATGAEPIYLRRPDARVPGPPKRVTVP